MSMAYIRSHYNVPAKLGGRVKYSGGSDKKEREGTIVWRRGASLVIRLDGASHTITVHPTWKLEYL
ncbi:MAG: hypothetical protein KAJ73_00180 [Zetaproteobacteria bacterium]|nr:hypothetical protein [Zetaproteobacteria bacterium]